MNNYERYMGMVRGEKVDIVPRIPILMFFAARYGGVTYGRFAADVDSFVQANIKLIEDFGFDQLDVMCDPYRETTDFGGQIEYLDDNVPRCTVPLADTMDLSVLKKIDPHGSGRTNMTVRAVEAYKAYGYQKYSITGWVEGPAAEAADLRGISQFLMDLATEESFACELMDICVEAGIEYARAQVAAGADTIGVGDAIASQISPAMYEKLVAPREKRLFDGIHEAGGLVRLHVCGDISALLPTMAGLGIDILDCDWMVDIVRARQIMGDKITLTGNLDPVEKVMRSTPQQIHEDFTRLYEQVGNPYFVNAGCEVPRDTPDENLAAMCKPIEAK